MPVVGIHLISPCSAWRNTLFLNEVKRRKSVVSPPPPHTPKGNRDFFPPGCQKEQQEGKGVKEGANSNLSLWNGGGGGYIKGERKQKIGREELAKEREKWFNHHDKDVRSFG